MAGKVSANPAVNVQLAAGVKLFFLEASTARWLDMGAIATPSLEIATEFLEYFQNASGANALTKRFLQQRGLTLNFNMEEINSDNMRLGLLGGVITQPADVKVHESATLIVSTAGTLTMPEAADSIDSIIDADDTSQLYTGVLSTDGLTVTLSTTVPSAGTEVVVTYRVALTTNVESFSLLSNNVFTGQAQFRVRMQGGGIAQVYDFPSVELAPQGSFDISPDAVEAVPMVLTVREVNGIFGTKFLADVA